MEKILGAIDPVDFLTYFTMQPSLLTTPRNTRPDSDGHWNLALKFWKSLFKWIFLGIFFMSYKKLLSCFSSYNAYILLNLQTHSFLFGCQTNLSPAFIYFKKGFFFFATVMSAVYTKTVKVYQMLTVFISRFCSCFQIHLMCLSYVQLYFIKRMLWFL